jgi:DNA-binding transcriptional ArsR family regulator
MSRDQDEQARLWAAIADPTRRQLIDVILARGEATATVLAAEVPITRQGVAKHLTVLEGAGLVERRRHGKEVGFAVRPDRLDLASRWMADVARQWDSRLADIKRLAEARVSKDRT